jgi:hypothetical protein
MPLDNAGGVSLLAAFYDSLAHRLARSTSDRTIEPVPDA